MLARTRKTASELGLSEPQRAALELVLTHLRTGLLPHEDSVRSVGGAPRLVFNMTDWKTAEACGTVACIGGSAEILGGVLFSSAPLDTRLNWLFYPEEGPDCCYDVDYGTITTAQAADALELYLSTGTPQWDVVLGLTPRQETT